METAEASGCVGGAKPIRLERAVSQKDRLVLKRQTLEAMMEQWRQTLELLTTTGRVDDDDDDSHVEEVHDAAVDDGRLGARAGGEVGRSSYPPPGDCGADKFCSLLKSRVECLDFLEKLESAQASIPQSMSDGSLVKDFAFSCDAEEGSSWDVVNKNDLWEGDDSELEKEDYVLVRQEDIVDGIACFMAAYLLSLKETKDLTPNQIQEALSKTFSVKKKKGKLQKAWEGSKVIYNVASWGATAIGIYQNPAIIGAASAAFWSSCRVIAKLL